MKHLFSFTFTLTLTLTLALPALAQERAPEAVDLCELERKMLNAPYYYCDCKQNNTVFTFPMDLYVNDTAWFTASVSDLQQGLSAYWFADNCNIQLEVYAFCSSKAPSFTMAVGGNQMREMDVSSINKKLAEMGEAAKLMAETLTPRIRVYPLKQGGSGHAICYPYNQGPHSVCDAPLNVINGMTYVSNHDYDVYVLRNKTITKNCQIAVQWQEKKNAPCTMTVTRNTCDGEILAQMTLSDSTKLYYPDVAMMNAVKAAGDSLIFRFDHDSTKVGRIHFRLNPKFIRDTVNLTTCQGKKLILPDTILTQTTAYLDTGWITKDTIGIHTYNLTITPAPLEYDTIFVKSTQLPTLYQNQAYIPQGGYGDYDFTLSYTNDCDRHVLLHVIHQIDTIRDILNTTVCQGKTYKSGGVTYSEDVDITDSVMTNEDTYAIRDVHIHFTAPDTTSATYAVTESELREGFYYQGQLIQVQAFGDSVQITITKKNTCTKVVNLTVTQKISTDIQDANPAQDSSHRLVIENGHVFILQGKHKYSITGQIYD